MFEGRVALAADYARLLAGPGIFEGLIGPREVPRLWSRHLLNCAVLQEVVAPDTRLVDVGSGAGLPGIPLAIARPDVQVTLLEPMQRRVDFLHRCVDALHLDNVQVVRGRAEDTDLEPSPLVTARAVAPLARLARWCLPLVAPGGSLVALKGAGAADEVRSDEEELRDLGVEDCRVLEIGHGVVDPPTVVVRLVAPSAPPEAGPPGRRPTPRGGRRW